METKPTPGPWTIADDHTVAVVGGVENLYFNVGPALVDATPLGDAECEANARLIAAAPDLLAALEDTAEWLDGGMVDGVGFDEIQVKENILRAIAKARGE